MQRVERLTNSSDVKAENISFGRVEVGRVPGKDITYERIPITIIHGNNLFGSLFIKTEQCFSFGAQQNINKETGVVGGRTLPIVMSSRELGVPAQLFLHNLPRFLCKKTNQKSEEYPLSNVRKSLITSLKKVFSL